MFELIDENATRRKITHVFKELVNKVKEEDNLLIYFCGHGNFDESFNMGGWIPVDAEDDSDCLHFPVVRQFLQSIDCKHLLAISDSCYSGAITRGAPKFKNTEMEKPDHYMNRVYNLSSKQYVTSGGLEVVSDGTGNNSVFTDQFLKSLKANQNKYIDMQSLYQELVIPVTNNSMQMPRIGYFNTEVEQGQFVFELRGK